MRHLAEALIWCCLFICWTFLACTRGCACLRIDPPENGQKTVIQSTSQRVVIDHGGQP